MAERTLFDGIVDGSIPSWKIWEDDLYLAFLTPFPNTPGFTVVIPKINPGDYVFSVDKEVREGLIDAATKVAKVLEKALNVNRVALVFEGTGVAYLHAKLIPLHGDLASQTGVWSKHQEFYPEYIGYLSTTEGPRMNDEDLNEMQKKIQEVEKNEN